MTCYEAHKRTSASATVASLLGVPATGCTSTLHTEIDASQDDTRGWAVWATAVPHCNAVPQHCQMDARGPTDDCMYIRALAAGGVG